MKLGSRYPVLRVEAVLDRYRLHGNSVTGSAPEALRTASRRAFLDWCRAWCASGLPPSDRRRLEAAVDGAEWELRHPRLAGWRRRARKALRRLGGAS